MSKKVKIILEHYIKASPSLLFNYISTPSGLSEWFADDVDLVNNQYKFKWGTDEQVADVIKKTNNKCIKFHWADAPADEYFEFEIIVDELTGDVALVVTDFVDEADKENASQLWESQIHDLKLSIGA
jgi:uncharacterized protein YndB with AHSA1/START domain